MTCSSGTLAARGVRRGDVVMTLIGNRPEWVLVMVACFRLGAVALPCTEQLRAKDLALRIDHVGSTSVPELAAKPIIDMDVVVASGELVAPVIERLAGIGYRWRGDLGVEGRQAFEAPDGGGSPPHHLYLVVEHDRAHLDHVLLRDLLRQDADARDRYAALKRANIELAAGDMDVYVAAKAVLVTELLARARAEQGYPPVEYWTPEVPRPTP
ncbi:MAG: GrpB family protein, partial [Gemmatimonadetes bacterium]|nr:GrpB family protein [Gemmatimonadota bacterium]